MLGLSARLTMLFSVSLIGVFPMNSATAGTGIVALTGHVHVVAIASNLVANKPYKVALFRHPNAIEDRRIVSLSANEKAVSTPMAIQPALSDQSVANASSGTGKPYPVHGESSDIASTMEAMSRLYQIPSGLLWAISLTESGMGGSPWPWTLNVYGKPYRLTNWSSTVDAVKGFLSRGIQLVDVGPMQVDWQYHGWRFGTVGAAAQPLRNIAVAAAILREDYEKTGSWRAAVGLYHGGGQARRRRYINAVFSRFHPDSPERHGPDSNGGINLIPIGRGSIVALNNQ